VSADMVGGLSNTYVMNADDWHSSMQERRCCLCHHSRVNALMLGTAQWGSAYGITNISGRPSDGELSDLVAEARRAGVAAFDTAGAYGDAEARLRPWASGFQVTTKVQGADPNKIQSQLSSSLQTLGVGCVHACLLHDWSTLDEVQARVAADQLRVLRDSGMVRLIGVSAYDEGEVALAQTVFGDLDVVQVPINALDRRLENSAVLKALSEQGAEIQVRSVFLQGLLAGRSDTDLGRHPDVVGFHDYCAQQGQGPIEVALGFVKGVPWVSRVVVGVTGVDEFKGILKAWDSAVEIRPEVLGSSDLTLLDPRRWA